MMQPFLWSGGGKAVTPADVSRNRAVAAALANRIQRPQNMWEGVQSAVGDIGGGLLNWRADQMEQEGRDSYAQAFGGLNEGASWQELIEAAPNGFESPAQSMVWQALMQRQLKETPPTPFATYEDNAGDLWRYDPTDPNSQPELFLDGPGPAEGGGGALGTTIHMGRDAAGNPVPLQVGGSGFVPAALPPGVSWDPAGVSGERAGATVDAKTAAAARAALPGAEQVLSITQNAIDTLRNDAGGMGEWFGQVGPRGMYVHPGSKMGNWLAGFEQAKGQAFMQARSMLKGGGQITDYEGRRAEAAFSRLETAAAKGDQATFLQALDDFEMAVDEGYRKLLATAAGAYSAGPAGGGIPGATSGATDYKTKYGLE